MVRSGTVTPRRVIKGRMKQQLLWDLSTFRGTVACDTETTGLSKWHGDRPYAYSFCDREGRKAFIRGRVDPFTREVFLSIRDVRSLRIFFMNPKIEKVFFNAKFDVGMVGAGLNCPVLGKIHEAMFAVHCANSLEPSFKLKDLGRKYLEITKDDEQDLRKATSKARQAGKKKGWAVCKEDSPHGDDPIAADYWMADPALLQKYAVLDADRTMLLWLLMESVMAEENVRHTYNFEMSLWPVTYSMEERGVMIDHPQLKKDWVGYEKEIVVMKAELNKLAPGLNFKSPKQMGEFLFEKLKLPVERFTDSGNRSTDIKALRKMDHLFPRKLVKLRNREKALSFVKLYDRMRVTDEEFGLQIMHASFQQMGPATGRYACRRPNLQNVANTYGTHAEDPIRLRHLFLPRPGYTWYLFDYAQLEIRIFAEVAEEQFMLDAIAAGRDIHTEVTNKVWGGKGNAVAVRNAVHILGMDDSGVPNEKVEAAIRKFKFRGASNETIAEKWLASFDYKIVAAELSVGKKHTRSTAKMLGFLRIFGGGVKAAAELIGCPEDQAATFHNDYSIAFPQVDKYIDRLSRQAEKDGFIVNLYGRKLRVDPNISYRAVNYNVQGSAADLLKVGMVKVFNYIKETKLDAHQVMTIHDEQVIEVNRRHAYPWFLRKITRLMEETDGHMKVPIEVTMERRPINWLDKPKV